MGNAHWAYLTIKYSSLLDFLFKKKIRPRKADVKFPRGQ
jgi:hypothetical protein